MATSDKAVRDGQGVDETRADGLDVKGDADRAPELPLDDGRGGDHVG